jgi:ribonuclease HI
MIVTINTDASFHHGHMVGAFAFWIVCNQGKIMHSGELKEARHAQDAETKCIVNALHALLNSRFKGISRIIINTDCKFAINCITNANPKKNKDNPANFAMGLIIKLQEKHAMKKDSFEFRYVEAHSDNSNTRKWVNDWCDKAAKKMLWQKINRQEEKKE